MIFFEHKALYASEADVPEESYTIPFGEANVVREGAKEPSSPMAGWSAVRWRPPPTLAKSGIDVEVVDPRTMSPLDADTILETVEKTGRLVCVDEANPRCSIACDVSAMVSQEAFKSLKAGIQMVTAPHTPVPFSATLEDLYIPSAAQIASAVRKTLAH